MKLIVLKICNDVLEANIIKGHLESEGIHCFIANEHISNLLPSMYILKGEGPIIKVAESDFERAKELIVEQVDNDEEFDDDEYEKNE